MHSYISAEELWACTTCNACAEACPVNINPVDIIVQMRQYQVMEKSAAPSELNNMFTNLENNGAPWQFNQMDKANWVQGYVFLLSRFIVVLHCLWGNGRSGWISVKKG